MFERAIVEVLEGRLKEPRRFMQIVVGPRQTGKSTAVGQALAKLGAPVVSMAFDRPRDRRASRIEELWHQAREIAEREGEVILSLDEIQKVRDWSSTVKFLWDEDSAASRNVKVVLTGSSALTLQKGMAESLKGRFEELFNTQWTFSECREAFGYSLEQFLFFGGYPGASAFVDDQDRWFSYLHNSIIEPTITQDVLEMETVKKPALLRALFEIGAAYSAQEVSYRKLLGQLDDRGNVEVISHYLDLLDHAGLLTGLKKYDEKILVSKTSSPRLMVHDTSLMTAAREESCEALLADPAQKGHLVETAVGAYLIARSKQERFAVHWWRAGNAEVDFVLRRGTKRTAIEVKSGRTGSLTGLARFAEEYPGTYMMVVGGEKCPLEDFLLGNVPLFQ